MLFMVIERFKGGDPAPVYARLREQGRALPDGLRYVDSWVEANFDRCFQLMECDDAVLLQRWVLHWRDLIEFEIVSVSPSKTVRELFPPGVRHRPDGTPHNRAGPAIPVPGDMAVPQWAAKVDTRMTLPGLSVEGGCDAGGQLITYFAIPPGREADAGRDLLACLAGGAEVCLRNDRDEGGEGCTFFRRAPSGLVTRVGGHGWQGAWGPTDEAGVLAAVAELADLNRGGHWSR